MEEIEYQDVEFLDMEDVVPQIQPKHVYKCSVCPKFTTDNENSMKKHLLIHENGKRPCKICGKNFYHIRMIYHLSTEHRNDKESIKILKEFMETERKECPMCHKRFPLDALEIHFQAGNCFNNVENTNIPKLRKAEVYKCKICPSLFVNFRNYYRHEKVHDKGTIQCIHCTKYLLECDMKYHLDHVHPDVKDTEDKENIQELFECKFCSKKFNRSFVHKRHESFHEAGKEFCKLCERFYSAKDIQWHTENMHPKSKPAEVEELPDKQPDFELKLNVIPIEAQPDSGTAEDDDDDELTDDADQNFGDPFSQDPSKHKCQFCSKSFTGRYTLTRHEKLHTSGKVYCEVCDRFIAKSEFEDHKHTVKRVLKKPTSCKYCSKTFTRNFVRKRHEKQHEMGKHFCKECNKFYSPEDMDWHMTYVHSQGQKPAFVQCPKCPKLFTKMEYCLSHQKTHDEKTEVVEEGEKN